MIKTIEAVNGQTWVTLVGSMYVEESAELRQDLIRCIEAGDKQFVLDLTGLDYIDSSGLGTLVAIHKRALQNGGSVALKGAKGIVKDLLGLTSLDKVFEML